MLVSLWYENRVPATNAMQQQVPFTITAMIHQLRGVRRIQILKQEATKNEFFEVIYGWVPVKTIWCSVKQQYFKDYQQTFGTTLENTTNFIIRYDSGKYVTVGNRIMFKNRMYRIINILEGSFDRDFTTLVCKEVEE